MYLLKRGIQNYSPAVGHSFRSFQSVPNHACLMLSYEQKHELHFLQAWFHSHIVNCF